MKNLALLLLPISVLGTNPEDKNQPAEEKDKDGPVTGPIVTPNQHSEGLTAGPNSEGFTIATQFFRLDNKEGGKPDGAEKESKNKFGKQEYKFGNKDTGFKLFTKVNGARTCGAYINSVFGKVTVTDLTPAEKAAVKFLKGASWSDLRIFPEFKGSRTGKNASSSDAEQDKTQQFCQKQLDYWISWAKGSGASSEPDTTLSDKIKELQDENARLKTEGKPNNEAPVNTGTASQADVDKANKKYEDLKEDVKAVSEGKSLHNPFLEGEEKVEPAEDDYHLKSKDDVELVKSLVPDNTLMIVAWVLAAVLPILVAVIFLSRSDSSEEAKDDEDEDAE